VGNGYCLVQRQGEKPVAGSEGEPVVIEEIKPEPAPKKHTTRKRKKPVADK
jgi:hypothetical protein